MYLLSEVKSSSVLYLVEPDNLTNRIANLLSLGMSTVVHSTFYKIQQPTCNYFARSY